MGWGTRLAALAVSGSLWAGAAAASPDSRRLIEEARALAHASPPQLEQAEATLLAAVRADPEDPDALFFLAYTSVACGHPEQALHALDELEARAGLRPHAAFLRGRALEQLGRTEEAQQAYAREVVREDFLVKAQQDDEVPAEADVVPDTSAASGTAPDEADKAMRGLVATGVQLDNGDGSTPGTPLTGRGVTSVELGWFGSPWAALETGLALGGSYLASFDGQAPATWNGHIGTSAQVRGGSFLYGGEVGGFTSRGTELGPELNAGILRTWTVCDVSPRIQPRLGYEYWRRHFLANPTTFEEDRDGDLHVLDLSLSVFAPPEWIEDAGFRLALDGARENTVGGFFDSTTTSALFALFVPLPLSSWGATRVEVGGSVGRCRYTDPLQLEVMGADRVDTVSSAWVRLRQPLWHPRTSLDVQWSGARTRSTIEGLASTSQQGSLGVSHAF